MRFRKSYQRTLKGVSLTLAAFAGNTTAANIPDDDLIVTGSHDDDILITEFDNPNATLIPSPDVFEHGLDIIAETSSFSEETDSHDVAELHWTYYGGTGGDKITTPSRPLTIRDKLFSGNMMGGLAAIAAAAVLGWGWIRRRRKG